MFVAVPTAVEPLDPEKTADSEEGRSTHEICTTDRRHRRIALVVDDSEDAQVFCRGVLEDEGFWVQTAADGQEALDLLFGMPTPTIIVLDLLMPKMGGHELLDVIRAYHRLADVPVLVITAADEELDPAPRTELLRKPLSCDRFAERIRALVGGPLH